MFFTLYSDLPTDLNDTDKVKRYKNNLDLGEVKNWIIPVHDSDHFYTIEIDIEKAFCTIYDSIAKPISKYASICKVSALIELIISFLETL